ncbi:uncharacterized protein CDAR_317191 [Caerostris darwini]|uniref:Uncharacterized protein n=1 Tax=Caerostris darwini TaxID=1538125 RepID=A0AAV4NQH7_9ARAC|nr:uncharacterized protein CDAR_317191 [Caerostris darwini]
MRTFSSILKKLLKKACILKANETHPKTPLLLGITETATSYQPPPLAQRELCLPPKGELRPEGDFEGITTHKTDFTPKYQPRSKPCKLESKWKRGDPGKFEGVTTHAYDYKCPPLPEKPEIIKPIGNLQTSEGPFEGVSHYKRDFPAHETTLRTLPKWHPSFQRRKTTDGPMSGQTTYRTDFEAPPEELQQPYQKKPLKHNLTIPSGTMEKTTTSMRDYQRIENPILSISCRPDSQYKKPEGKFSGCTTTHCDYTPKMVEKPVASKLPDNLGPEDGPMEDLTTSMRDFQGLGIDCPAKYIKLYGKEALPQYKFDKTEKGHDFFKKLKKSKQSCG